MFEKKFFFGIRKSDNALIYLTAPKWDCDWYWSFGYLGNKNEHYHLINFENGRNINMYDALITDYNLNEKLKDNLWIFCELAQTVYTLKETAEVLTRGGSNYTTNPLKDLIKNPNELERLNNVVLPALFKEIEKLFN